MTAAGIPIPLDMVNFRLGRFVLWGVVLRSVITGLYRKDTSV
jgi:hypothetical protein